MNARVFGSVHLKYGYTDFNVKENIDKTIRNSLNIPLSSSGKITLYKVVKQISAQKFQSLHDASFVYRLNRKTFAEYPNMRWEESCASGLHASTYNYWIDYLGEDDHIVVTVEIEKKDIICCQEGKVRCKAMKVVDILK